jgi:hypothetical protein
MGMVWAAEARSLYDRAVALNRPDFNKLMAELEKKSPAQQEKK